MFTSEVNTGDYVLATKWDDGDPHDQWCVGFVAGFYRDRILVADLTGNLFRANGFRRWKRVTPERGIWLLSNRHHIQSGDKSLWWWVRRSMKKEIFV